MAFTIQYSISTDFPNQAVFSDRLEDEIVAAIATALEEINTNGDDCDIIFAAEPSESEKTALNGIVAAHDGTPYEPAGYFAVRSFFPASWTHAAIAKGQTTGIPMLVSATSFAELPVPRAISVVSVSIVLSEAVTANFIRFEVTKNGVPTGKTVDMDAAAGSAKIWEFASGRFMLEKGDRIGVNWGSHPSLAPNGVIDALVFFEVE
jgi:hypothetical protein